MNARIIAALLCMGVLASCNREDIEPGRTPDYTQAAIVPTAGVSMSAAPSSRADLPGGPVAGTTFPENTTNLFAVTAYKGTATPTDFSTTYFANAAVQSDANGALGFMDGEKYYPANAEKLYFYAYSPVNTGSYTAGGGGAPPTVAWTLTGQEDIMYANDVRGIGKASAGTEQPQPEFGFKHLLKQVRFKLVKGTGFGDGIYAERISITHTGTQASLDLQTGGLTFSDAGRGTLSIDQDGGYAILGKEYAEEIDQVLLCEPGKDLHIEVEVQGTAYEAELELADSNHINGAGPGAGGVSYLVTLTFIGTQIQLEAEIVDWVDVGETDGTIE